MNFYDNHVLPRVLDRICGHRAFSEQRAKAAGRARGRVLEVGYGSGTSLPAYRAEQVEQLIALDPAEGAMSLASDREAAAPFPIDHLALRGEEIPLENESVDSVVVAYTLCTIPDVVAALGEMRRVLRPDGALLFAEHGEAPTEARRRWQRRIAPAWQLVFGGCQLTRNPFELLETNGFKLEDRETLDLERPPPIPGLSLVRYNYVGVARPV